MAKEKIKEEPVEEIKEEPVEEIKEVKKERGEFIRSYVFKKISSIVFGILSPKMIKKMASAKVVFPLPGGPINSNRLRGSRL